MFELGSKFLLSYFLGSIMGALVVGRLKGGVDIRTMGSGNAGGTNALRTQGRLFALGVIVIDIGKGALAAGIVPELPIGAADETPLPRDWIVLICAAAAVMGHVWPVYHRFQGGKGAATYIGALLVVAPLLLVPMLLTWALSLVLSGFVGLSTILASFALPASAALMATPADKPALVVFGLFMAVFITWCHRSNIQRMRAGNENRNERVMLLRRRG
jgi:glycerol-3-phosphate acyltransferase PlsY